VAERSGDTALDCGELMDEMIGFKAPSPLRSAGALQN